jgi:sugar-specific transcriptional regulator TrmB
MNDSKTVDTLKLLGIPEREAELYLQLVRHPEMTAGELHRLTGINRPRTYALLAGMVTRGLCQERVAGKHRYFTAVKPAQLLARLERELAYKQEQAAATLGQLDTLFNQSRQQDRALDFIEVIRNREQINQYFLTCNQQVESELLTFHRTPYAVTECNIYEEMMAADQESLERGVQFRTIYMMEEEHRYFLHLTMDRLRSSGDVSFRLADTLPIKMFIFDRKKVMLALSAVPGVTAEDFTMIAVEDPGFATACVSLFEFEWAKSMTEDEWIKKHGRPQQGSSD